MPRKPLLSSAPMQQTAVAAAMAAVFVVSMLLAWFVSRGAPAQAPAAAQQLIVSKTAELPGLTIEVPRDWQRRATLEAHFDQRLGGSNSHVWIDPSRDTRGILVTSLRLDEPATPVAVRDEAIRRGLLTPVEAQTFELIGPQVLFEHNGVPGVSVVGISAAEEGVVHQEHFIAVVSGDGLTHWLFYLSDRLQPGEQPGALLKQNADLFRNVLQSAELSAQARDQPAL